MIFNECSNEQSFMHFLYHEINRKIEQIDVLTNNYTCRAHMSSADIFVTGPCTCIISLIINGNNCQRIVLKVFTRMMVRGYYYCLSINKFSYKQSIFLCYIWR